ncbi:MAG TPA: Type 1 glutamine amidotransferase-like domain-containing protein [Candidatus Paceibacterota bacterium]|nr:Type 1 glutamine amidotransferase-like domain-containing protein [Candidatus Paceibacterota bacterium]
MTTCILHGGYTREDNELNAAFYRDFAAAIPDGSTILYVYFATRVGKESGDADRFVEHQRFVAAGAPEKNFTSVFAEKDSFVEQARAADAIFINGGVPENLMAVLHLVPDIKGLFEGKIIAGSSSGAFALSKYYYSIDTTPGVYEGFGIAPVRVLCHYMSETDEYIGDEGIEALKAYPDTFELVVLKDCEHKVITV